MRLQHLCGWTFFLALQATLSAAANPFASIKEYSRDDWNRSATDCDRLAAHPSDPEAVLSGVGSADFPIEAAIETCVAAVNADPENPRLNYQLGRAYGYGGRHGESQLYLQNAVNAGYPQALFVVGYIQVSGWDGAEGDACYGGELIRRSALAGRFAGLVGFPHYALQGVFAHCTQYPPIDQQEIRAFLRAAGPRATDFYQRLLVEQLMTRVENCPESESLSVCISKE